MLADRLCCSRYLLRSQALAHHRRKRRAGRAAREPADPGRVGATRSGSRFGTVLARNPPEQELHHAARYRKLADDVRESVAQAFRELLTNAIEWGGRLDSDAQLSHLVPAREAERGASIADPGEGFTSTGWHTRRSRIRPTIAGVRSAAGRLGPGPAVSGSL